VGFALAAKTSPPQRLQGLDRKRRSILARTIPSLPRVLPSERGLVVGL
jgi:hypothetical protein